MMMMIEMIIEIGMMTVYQWLTVQYHQPSKAALCVMTIEMALSPLGPYLMQKQVSVITNGLQLFGRSVVVGG